MYYNWHCHIHFETNIRIRGENNFSKVASQMSDQLYGWSDMPTVGQPMLKLIDVIEANMKSVQPFFWYSLINAFLSPQKFLCGSRYIFLSFIFIAHFFCESSGSFFKLSFYTFTCLSNNSLISSWTSAAKFVSALLLCMFYMSYYYQSEVNTWMYLRRLLHCRLIVAITWTPFKWFA